MAINRSWNDNLPVSAFRVSARVVKSASLLLVLALSACASDSLYKLNLMPAPDIYDEGSVNPFTDKHPMESMPYRGVLYATDRAPVTENTKDSKELHYQNKRGHLIRTGIAHMQLGEEKMTWEEARRISLLKNRTDKYPMQVTRIEELGLVDTSVSRAFMDLADLPEDLGRGGRELVRLVNKKLAMSKHKHVYIYVHGYKVNFDNPMLVSVELWHFLGYEGAFIAYAWPSTPKLTAYAKDIETAAYSARYLRKLIEYLAANSDASRIHIVGYSAGTRVVINTLSQLALQNSHLNRARIARKLRVGQVILVGSDFDRSTFAGFIEDGMLKVPEHLSIYMSANDKALRMSRWVFDRGRLGQMFADGELQPGVERFMRQRNEISFINVSNAEASGTGNGHAYFRQSPWVSSDVLMTLMYGLPPGQRGLVRSDANPIWTFPEDYIARLRQALGVANPALAVDSRQDTNSKAADKP